MKCVVCGKETETKEDVCKQCDSLMDLFYRKNPEDKEMALKMFRECQEETKNEKSY